MLTPMGLDPGVASDPRIIPGSEPGDRTKEPEEIETKEIESPGKSSAPRTTPVDGR